MKPFIAIGFISIAAAMSVRPLPRLLLISKIQLPKLTLKPNVKRKISFEDELQFIFNLKSQLHAGVNQADAIKFAASRAPGFALSSTRQALASQTNAYSALVEDSLAYNAPSLARCANLLELSSQSGSSVNEALTQVADKLMNRRNQEQLIATELASTKATVFVLAGLPIMGAGMGLMLGADSMSWLFGSSAGRVCLVLGLGLELVGWLWIKRLLNRASADVT
jgi:tight adherence protein B